MLDALRDALTEATPQVTLQVTPQVAEMLRQLHAEMSREALQRALDLRDRKSFVDVYLKPALMNGLIEMTLPDKPNSRLQKYRLTDKGRQLRMGLVLD